MVENPLEAQIAFFLGPVPITEPVVVTWGVMAVLALGSILLTRGLRLRAGTGQFVLELVIAALDDQIRAAVGQQPTRFRALIGTLFLFILAANWSSLVPGVEPPTAHLETDAALAAIVFFATIWFGVTSRGVLGYLKGFTEPSWVMLPLNLVEQITRTFSLMVRLFGNIMGAVFVIGIVLSLAGLLLPIPLMALDLLTGAVQAYIFATLAIVFIASAVGEGARNERTGKERA
jgi:F-type H+-transporting ATPase subunit a